MVINPLKEIWESPRVNKNFTSVGSPRVNENLTSVGFEPTTSGLDLPMLYRLSCTASTGTSRDNLGGDSRSTREIGNNIYIFFNVFGCWK